MQSQLRQVQLTNDWLIMLFPLQLNGQNLNGEINQVASQLGELQFEEEDEDGFYNKVSQQGRLPAPLFPGLAPPSTYTASDGARSRGARSTVTPLVETDSVPLQRRAGCTQPCLTAVFGADTPLVPAGWKNKQCPGLEEARRICHHGQREGYRPGS